MSRLFLCILLMTPMWAKGQVRESKRIDISVSIPEIAMIDLAPNSATIELSLTAPRQAGDPVDMSHAFNDSKWINYTSSIAPGGARKNITAQIISGVLPGGLKLNLGAGKYQGTGKGKRGKSHKQIVLNGLPQTILKDIGRAYTGKGIHQGHQIFFSLSYDDYDDIEFGVSTIVVVFTLTDN